MWAVILVIGLTILLVLALNSREKFSNVNPDIKRCPRASMESRRLWREHVYLTRIFLVKYLDDLPDVNDSLVVLLRNQEDIGEFINLFAPGTQDITTALLKEHISGAGEILKNAKEGKDLGPSVAKWYDNASVISKTLAPVLNLDQTQLDKMMRDHLQTTLDEAQAHISGNVEGEERAYCEVIKHILVIADYLVSRVPCKC